MDRVEVQRQIVHLLFGPLLVVLHARGILTLELLLAILMIGLGLSFLIKRRRISLMRRMLGWFEREHHMENFPGRGAIAFTLGAFLCLLLFDTPIAYAGILILSAGDAVANFVGRHFGRIKTRLNPNKYLEGTLLGILVSAPIAYGFVPNPIAAVVTAVVAMFLELPNLRLGSVEIDDNLLIPLAASFTLSLFA